MIASRRLANSTESDLKLSPSKMERSLPQRLQLYKSFLDSWVILPLDSIHVLDWNWSNPEKTFNAQIRIRFREYSWAPHGPPSCSACSACTSYFGGTACLRCVTCSCRIANPKCLFTQYGEQPQLLATLNEKGDKIEKLQVFRHSERPR